jgi:hypothetical protein
MEAADFAAAECGCRAILDKFPGDPVAKFMLKECGESRATDLSEPASEPNRRTSMRT